MNIKDLQDVKVITQPTLNIRDLQGVKPLLTGTQLADAESAKAYKALFPNVTGGESVVSGGLKTLGNLPGSALNTLVNILKIGGTALLYDNPVSKMLNIGQDKSVLNMVSKTASGAISKLAGTSDDFMQEEKKSFTDFKTEMAKRFGPAKGYLQLGEELFTGKIAQGVPGHKAAQEVIETLQRTFVNDPSGAGLDIGGTIAGGAGAIGKTKQLGKAVSKTGKLITSPVEDAVNLAKTTGTAVKNKAVDLVTPMEKGVEKVLQTTGIEKWDDYLTQAKNAAVDYSLPTALEKAGNVGEEALQTIRLIMDEAQNIKKSATAKLADKSVGNIVDKVLIKFREGLAERVGAGITSKGEIVELAGRSLAIAKSADNTLIKLVFDKLSDLAENPTFKRVDDTIDTLQGILYEGRQMGAVPINSKVEGLMKQIVGELNENLKIIGGVDYRGANAFWSEAKNIFDKLNKSLGEDVSKGGSLMKRVFSPTDGGTKKLFAQVKALTGIDLVEEATLAKLAMEIAGDARQASLLEQLELLRLPGKGSFAMEAGKWILKKLQDTEGKAKNIIKKATGGKK